MPCDTVTTQSVALTKAIPIIVEEALKTLGWITDKSSTKEKISARLGNSTLTWAAGKGVTIRGPGNQQEQITALTKTYSVKAVSWAAKRAGWTVQQTADDKLTVTRR